jgi:hypothetical protein
MYLVIIILTTAKMILFLSMRKLSRWKKLYRIWKKNLYIFLELLKLLPTVEECVQECVPDHAITVVMVVEILAKEVVLVVLQHVHPIVVLHVLHHVPEDVVQFVKVVVDQHVKIIVL